MRDIIFFLRANYIIGHFKGYFEGAKTFLTPKLSRVQRGAILGSKKSRPPRNIPRNGPLCSLPKTKKNNIPNFLKSAVHWFFYVPLRPEPSILSYYVFIFSLFYFFIVFIKICGENPAKYPRLSKNPPKYTTAYIVHQSNCRWHCEPSCFSN
jgi:hypothetical protein